MQLLHLLSSKIRCWTFDVRCSFFFIEIRLFHSDKIYLALMGFIPAREPAAICLPADGEYETSPAAAATAVGIGAAKPRPEFE